MASSKRKTKIPSAFDFGFSDMTDLNHGEKRLTEEIKMGDMNEPVRVSSSKGVVIFINGSAVQQNTKIKTDDKIKCRIPAGKAGETVKHSISIGPITNYIYATTLTVDGEKIFNKSGIHKWKCPKDVFSISVAAIGAGGIGQDYPFGSSTYKNSIDVVPGREYYISVGEAGNENENNGRGGDSFFTSQKFLVGFGGVGFIGDGTGLTDVFGNTTDSNKEAHNGIVRIIWGKRNGEDASFPNNASRV